MGSKVNTINYGEYGRMEVCAHEGLKLFGNIFIRERKSVWMSHRELL